MATKRPAKGRKPKKAKEVDSCDGHSDGSTDVGDVMLAMDEAFDFPHDSEENAVSIDTFDALAAWPPIAGHRDCVKGFAFDRESSKVFTCSWDKTVLIWDALKVEQVGVLPHASWVNSVAAVSSSVSGLQVFTASEDGNLTMWQQFETPTGVEFNVAGQWRVSHGPLTSMHLHEESTVYCVSLDQVVAFNIASGSIVRTYRLDSEISVVLTVDELLYCGCDSGKISCLDVIGGFALRQLTGHKGAVRQLIVAAAYNTLFSAGDDGAVRVWMLSTGLCTKIWKIHTHPIISLTVHVGERDRFLYSAAMDGTVRCTRIATGASSIARHCPVSAMCAIDLPDQSHGQGREKPLLSAAAVAAANLRLGAAPTSRRSSIRDEIPSSLPTGGRLFCGDFKGRLFVFPTSSTENNVLATDIQKQRARM